MNASIDLYISRSLYEALPPEAKQSFADLTSEFIRFVSNQCDALDTIPEGDPDDFVHYAASLDLDDDGSDE